jgi:proline utilization trans-activator
MTTPSESNLTVMQSFYAAIMNRRHTAVLLSGQSLRLCLVLGLHIEISDTQLKDPALREHRCRLWWTAYRFDRLWCGRVGIPPSIPDESIEIRLPSAADLPIGSEVDFRDAEHLAMSVRLSRILSRAVNTLYVWKRQQTSFSERVQQAVRSLRDWAEQLPEHLRMRFDQPLPPHVQYMHLSFIQSVIVVTRPVLLHLYRQSLPRREQSPATAQPFSDPALSLTTACVRYARQSTDLLKRSWADGTFLTFDYFHVQFLFSSATILALSALIQGTGWANDREDFLLACSFLHQLKRNGNFAAKEFTTHIDALKAMLLADAGGDATIGQPTVVEHPPLQDFLNFPDIDLDFMETDAQWLEFQNVCWPEMQNAQGV